MDQLLPGDTDERRISIRTWLAEHPRPTPRQLAHAGYVAPHWPAPWGLAADPIHQLIIDDELARAGVQRPSNAIGIGWAGPTIAYAGSEEQKERYLFPLLTAEEIWCQLFSEPGSGSDLASLSTRAERDGDEWVVNGSKIWTSGAQHSQFGILLARTNPDAAKHKGITYFICPMNLPGIDIRPIREMTGGETFNEVFFTDVRLPLDAVVGEVNDGWRLAKVTLGNERVSLSTGGVLWGHGPTALDLVAQIKRAPVTDPVLRQNIAKAYIEHQILELIRMRTLSARIRGEQPGPEASVRKILADEHGQHVMDLALSLQGASGMIANAHVGGLSGTQGASAMEAAVWYYGFLFAQALTIGGGTGAVQRNIVGERVLGLPHEPEARA
ncbi:MAG: acyl-CoA dehydrogenase family protein [Ilumatobacteraceae bacterium]|nr:acyl-CoA dehydrogenase family protein [Ilumatobacteraceae bacterium]